MPTVTPQSEPAVEAHESRRTTAGRQERRGLIPPRWRAAVCLDFLRNSLKRRIVLLSIAVGIAAAFAAFALLLGLEVASHFCQGMLMGVSHPGPGGERIAFLAATVGRFNPWLVVLLPALGGLLSGVLVYGLAPEAEGHGMDATIHAFHHGKGIIRIRVPFVKALASIVTIGSGGSGGREGPIAQIAGGIGSWLAMKFNLTPRERRSLMLAGTGAGIGAIFRAPLGGAISALELLYKEDFESSAAVPAIVGSVTAYTLFRTLLALPGIGITSTTIYILPENLVWHMPADVPLFLVLAAVCAGVGRLYIAVFHGCRKNVFSRIPVPRAIRPCIGGLLIGLIGLLSVRTLGAGHGYLQTAMDTNAALLERPELLRLMRSFVALAMLKVVTTSFTIGSGGSGGVFGPSLVIGGLLGAGVGCLGAALMPQAQVPCIAVFVVLGMASFFAGVAHAPIGTVIMVSEMTGSYHLLAPLLLVCVVSMLLNRHRSIYASQVENRFQSPAHRSQLVADVLADVTAGDCCRRIAVPVVSENMAAGDLRLILANPDILFPLVTVNAAGEPSGMLTMGDTRAIYFQDVDERLFIVRDMAGPLVTCRPDEPLGEVLAKFENSGYSRIPMVDPSDPARLLGCIVYQDVMRAYMREIERWRGES